MNATRQRHREQGFKIRDAESTRTWNGRDQNELGPMLRQIRENTPKNYNWQRKRFVVMSREDLAVRINRNLSGVEVPITAGIIARIEKSQNVYGGYMMRVMQIVRGLRLRLFTEKKS